MRMTVVLRVVVQLGGAERQPGVAMRAVVMVAMGDGTVTMLERAVHGSTVGTGSTSTSAL